MPYIRVPDPLLDVKKPGRSADWKQIRDNQDYFDAQITAAGLGIRTDQDIRDHFMSGTTISTVNWTQVLNASLGIVSQHKLHFEAGGASTEYAIVHGTSSRLRIIKTAEYVAFCKLRVQRRSPGSYAGSYFFGWQDDALTTTLVTDVSDCVGVTIGSSATAWLGRTSNGGSASTTGDFATNTDWNIIQINLTCSATAGLRQAEFFLNGVSVSTLSTDANIPAATLKPTIGVNGLTAGAQSGGLFVDYAEFGFATIPTAA